MIKLENYEVLGWEHAIRGMRNPMNSWEKSDSFFWNTSSHLGDAWGFNETVKDSDVSVHIGQNDHELMTKLANAGTDHRKFMRMIAVYVDITAPTFWWSEFDTYKVGTVRNSCSKMHKIHIKPFDINDFTHEGCCLVPYAYEALVSTIETCERLRQDFNRTQDRKYWRALIELLPEGYNIRATVMFNYEVLANAYHSRKNHKVYEWREFCEWIETLPYSEFITGKE